MVQLSSSAVRRGGKTMAAWRSPARGRSYRRAKLVATRTATVAVFLGLGPIAVSQLAAPSASAQGTNCAASTSSETQLNEAAFTATAPVPSTSSGAQNAITNAVNHTNPNRFTSGAAQASGDDFIVNLGSAQTFNEIEMSAPDYSGDYARGFNVNVSANGTTWTTVASCTGTGDPEIVSFTGVTYQYLEVVLTAATSPSWWSMEEFLIYNGSGTTTTTTASTTTTTAATTTTTATGVNCSAAVAGTALSRSAWVASTNTPASGADVASNAIDGNLTTRFSSDEDQAAGEDWEANMGSAQTFNELEMEVPNSAGDYARGYSVEVSANGTTWTTVATCTGTGTPEIVSFPAQTAQYFEVVLTAASTTNWWSIDELYLYNTTVTTTTGATTTTASTTTTTAATTTTTGAGSVNCSAAVSGAELNRSAWVASTNTPASGADVASNAIDGNLTTRFSSDEDQAAGEDWEANMGSAQTFNELEMEVPNSAGDYARGYSVEVSANGTTWTTVATCTGTGTPEVVSFPIQTAQYFEIVLTTGVTTDWWSIDELYLYNTTVTATPCGSTSGNAPWPNYGGNLAHSNLGVDVSGSATTLSQSWTTAVDGAVYGQSLLAGGCLFVGTENNSVYAVDPANGLVVWHVNLGTPVTSGLPCGDIDPSGITATPAIDPATGDLWVVINTDVSGSPAHELVELNSSNGSVLSTQVLAVPGTDPTAQGVRAAVDVANGYVYVTFGGLYGDCGTYLGAIAAVPEAGGTTIWYKVPTSNQAGMWEPGGPDILANGDLLVADGNGAAGSGQPFDGGDAVIELSPNLSSVQYFAPSNWATLNSTDDDLGDTAPAVLPNNQALQVGKNGTGYLISTTTLGGVGGQLYTAQICHSTDDANYGGSAVSGDIVYVPCSDGIAAVSVSGNSFSTLWYSSGGGLGSIVLAGGDLFEQVQNGTLYEINASNGAVLQTLSLSAPGAHWPSLTVVGSTLYVENGSSMEALSGV